MINTTSLRLSMPSVSRQTFVAVVGALCCVLAEVMLGLLLPKFGPTGALLVVLVVLAPVALLVKGEHLVALTLISLYTSRLLVMWGAPAMLNFAHYPLAMIAMVKLLQTRGEVNGPLITWLIASLVLTALSSALGGWAAFRPIMGWVILFQPFIFFGLISAMDTAAKKRLRTLAIVIALVQVPWSISQFAAHSFGDPVQGTLVHQGAGHHIMGAICVAAAWLLLWSGGKRSPLLLFVCGVLLSMGVLSDAKQVYGALILAVLVVGALQGQRVASSLLLPGLALMALMYVSAQFYEPMEMITDTEITEEYFGSKVDQIEDIVSRLGPQSVLGLGMGNGVSRAALSSVPGYASPPPTLLVGDEPAELAMTKLAGYAEGEVSSAASPFLSWLSIFSDIGLLGVLVYLALCVVVVRQLRGADERHRRISYVMLALAGILGYIFTWLEEPAFTVYIAVIIGCGLPSRDEATAVETFAQTQTTPLLAGAANVVPTRRAP